MMMKSPVPFDADEMTTQNTYPDGSPRYHCVEIRFKNSTQAWVGPFASKADAKAWAAATQQWPDVFQALTNSTGNTDKLASPEVWKA